MTAYRVGPNVGEEREASEVTSSCRISVAGWSSKFREGTGVERIKVEVDTRVWTV